MLIDFFFLSCRLRTHPVVLAHYPYGNPDHPTYSNEDLLSATVPSISRRSSNFGSTESHEIGIEPPVSVQHPTLSSLHMNTN